MILKPVKIGNASTISRAAMEDARKFVDKTISSKPVVVFSKSYCPFCVKAKNLLVNDLKLKPEHIEILEIENRPDCNAIQAALKDITGASSVSLASTDKRQAVARHHFITSHTRLTWKNVYPKGAKSICWREFDRRLR